MTLAEIILRGFISWAVINTVLMLVWIALMWHDGRSAERANFRSATPRGFARAVFAANGRKVAAA